MLLVFCNNYRDVEKLNVFNGAESPYIEFYIPRVNTEVELCTLNEVKSKIDKIKASLVEGESLKDFKLSNFGENECAITYSIRKEVMYNIPIQASHRELRTHIDAMIKSGEVIDIDRIQAVLNKSKENSLYEFAENIIRRI